MRLRTVFFVTHAEVSIDPDVPVPQWPLSEKGRHRHMVFNQSQDIKGITAVYCSGEQKAIDGAQILCDVVGVRYNIVHSLHENDRSATGFLPPSEFQATADLFFAHPEESIRGWERAVDAQKRVVSCVDTIIQQDPTEGDIAIVAHGGVGTLLLCHLRQIPISRSMDQPGGGGGNYFAFDVSARSVIHSWKDIAPAKQEQ